MDAVTLLNVVAGFLWAIVGIIGGLLVIWFLWQILQVGKNIREYGVDYIGFLRGEIQLAADEEGIEILRPTKGIKDRRSRIKRIIENKNKES